MRFCFLASRDWRHPEAAGGDLYLGNIARHLVARGHKVLFVASGRQGLSHYETVDGVDTLQLKPGALYTVRLIAAFFLLRGTADVIVEEVFGGKGIPPLALFYSNKPVVSIWYQRHDRIFAEQYPSAIAKILSLAERLLARAYRRARVVTLSEKSATELVELGLKRSQVTIVPSAATIDFPNVDELPRFEERDNSMIFIGKIRKYKRLDHAILALNAFAAPRIFPKLVVAGSVGRNDQDYFQSLQNLARDLGLNDRVEFKIYPGIIPANEKISLLARSKVLLQPSPVEGFSMTTIEGNLCGTPVVVSDGVPKDVVVHEQNGFVYKFGDIEMMAYYCGKLMQEASTWERLSENGLEMARRYNWENTTDAFENIAEKIHIPEKQGAKRVASKI